MTREQYIQKRIDIQKECYAKESELRRLYAIEHNPVKEGDIVTDHYHTIKVEKTEIYGHPVPYMVYHGIELTKQGLPKKHQPIRSNPVYQENMKEINGQPYNFEKEGEK